MSADCFDGREFACANLADEVERLFAKYRDHRISLRWTDRDFVEHIDRYECSEAVLRTMFDAYKALRRAYILAYQLDLFGPYTVEVSRDYKFAEGLLAVMGEAMIGGNVVTENGFIRVKKKAGT